MAKSSFWPVFIPVSAALIYGSWVMTPVISEKFLSPSSRENIRDLVAACVRHQLAPAPQATTTATPMNGAPSATTSSKQSGQPPATAAKPSANTKRTAAAPKPAAPVANSQVQESGDDDLPSLLGITQCQPGKAPWGVVNQVATAIKRKGEKITVPGGRFFIIKKREEVDGGYKLIGSFSPDTLGEPVALFSNDLYCFTGSPDKLSKNQQNCLRNYYELRGKAMARKAEILRANAAKSPYGRKAADALAKFKKLAAKVKNDGAEMSSDANRKATYELTNLKNQIQELGAKHKAWKEANASKLADPEQDSEYRNFLKEAQKYAEPINGMVF